MKTLPLPLQVKEVVLARPSAQANQLLLSYYINNLEK